MYKIQYLPIAKKDLMDIIDYITDTLKAPNTAINLLNEIEKAILSLEEFPFRCKVYSTTSKSNLLENEYRILPVKNYAIFYIVKENIVEIHRIVYSKMELNKILDKKT